MPHEVPMANVVEVAEATGHLALLVTMRVQVVHEDRSRRETLQAREAFASPLVVGTLQSKLPSFILQTFLLDFSSIF